MAKEEKSSEIGSKKVKSATFSFSNQQAKGSKIGHEEIFNLITSDEISWQALIQELVRSEQLNPLDIDITALTKSFLEKVRQLEEANFFVSGKVLLAAAILLRLKAEKVYDHLQYFDELLFGKEDEEAKEIQDYFIPHEELPIILPKTPLPRMKKVTMEELMQALDKAIKVEERRHDKYDALLHAEKEVAIVLPKIRINISESIKQVLRKIREFFSEGKKKLTFSNLIQEDSKKETKIETFIPLLHLDTREKITLEQEKAFGEIYISLYKKQEVQEQSFKTKENY